MKIKEAIARDGILSSGYGRIISIDDANDKYANGIGFINHVELIFAKNINADVRQINELKKFGVRNQTEYDNAVKEIVKSGYSPNTDLNTVFVYLKDFSDASDNNISILKQRTQRLEREKLAREAQMREEAKQLAINEAFAQLDEYRYSSRRGAEKSNNVSSSQFEKICAQTVPYVDSLSLQNNFGFNAGQQMAQLWRNMGEIAFKIRDVRWSKPQNICLVSVTAAGFLDGNTINKRFLCEVVVARRKSNSGFYIGELDNCMEAMVY